MPLTYDRNGVRFLYPDDWQVADEDHEGGLDTVSVQSASGAFWSVSVDRSAVTPEEMLRDALQTMQEVYSDVEVSSLQHDMGDMAVVGMEMEFFCLDLMVTAQALAWRHGAKAYLVLWQAENREFEEKELVFRAIFTSLLQQLSLA